MERPALVQQQDTSVTERQDSRILTLESVQTDVFGLLFMMAEYIEPCVTCNRMLFWLRRPTDDRLYAFTVWGRAHETPCVDCNQHPIVLK